MIFLIGSLLILALTAHGEELKVENACPSKTVKLVGSKYFKIKDDTCFLFMIYDKVVFGKARLKCKNSGGNLAMPKTKDTNDFLISEMKKLGNFEPTWIGMHDTVEEGKFVWEDGTDVDDLGNFDWKNGLFGGGEDCIALDPRDGKWHDYGCFQNSWLKVTPNHKLPFICQYPIEKDSGDADQGSDGNPVKGDQTRDDASGDKDQSSDVTAGNVDQGSSDAAGNVDQGSNDTAGNVNQGNNVTTVTTGPAGEELVDDDGCPPFNCSDLDCGMDGYKVKNGCQICECAENGPTETPAEDDNGGASDQGAGGQAAKDQSGDSGVVKTVQSSGNKTQTIYLHGKGATVQTTPGATTADAEETGSVGPTAKTQTTKGDVVTTTQSNGNTTQTTYLNSVSTARQTPSDTIVGNGKPRLNHTSPSSPGYSSASDNEPGPSRASYNEPGPGAFVNSPSHSELGPSARSCQRSRTS
ncbi:collectin-10 [Elysia marginata]|uniref:Collectin-10 n=1 Tax=Elysia marginata TaxID=1093978 RepID=A0AAV4JL60_9GAST|nr:collectin-10 [Elysia marginata]